MGMGRELKLSPVGAKLIRFYEGCKLNAYLDAANIPTIGYGNTFYEDGTKVKMGDTITKERAEELFWLIVPKFEDTVKKRITRKLAQNEFDALVSFCYNAGVGYPKPYNIWQHVNDNKPASFMLKYWQSLAITSAGKKLNGLVKRRRSESELYCNSMLNLY